MADDSNYSDGDIDVEDRIKLVKVSPLAVNTIEYEERKVKDGLCICEALSQAKLERAWGEVKVLECCWAFPGTLLHDHRRMYAGVGEEKNLEEESDRLNHQHRIYDRDREEYWDGILAYLHMKRLPASRPDAEKIQRHSRRFFILNGALWRKNGDNPPLLVILNEDI